MYLARIVEIFEPPKGIAMPARADPAESKTCPGRTWSLLCPVDCPCRYQSPVQYSGISGCCLFHPAC